MTSTRNFARGVALALVLLFLGAVQSGEAQPRAADPAMFFQAIEGTWVYVAKVSAGGQEQRSPGIVTFTRTRPTAVTFTAASRASRRPSRPWGPP